MSSRLQIAFALLLLAGCGPISREDAHLEATAAACDYYAECDQIGPSEDQQYEDRQECEVKVRDHFQSAWTKENCAEIIDEEFDNCVGRIRSTSCTNGLDFLNTLLVSCAATTVCES